MGETRTNYSSKHSSANRRWGFNQIRGAAGDHETVYMTRAWFGNLRFHIFHRGDQDPDCHDHPWDFWTFPLRSYVEEVLTPIRDTYPADQAPPPVCYQRRLEIVRAFRLHYRPATHTHRVLGLWNRHYDGWIKRGHQFVTTNTGKIEVYPAIKAGLIPTIVWRTAEHRKWGFTKERAGRWCWVAWKTYVYDGGKKAPCDEG